LFNGTSGNVDDGGHQGCRVLITFRPAIYCNPNLHLNCTRLDMFLQTSSFSLSMFLGKVHRPQGNPVPRRRLNDDRLKKPGM
jgi:hypothetical protein